MYETNRKCTCACILMFSAGNWRCVPIISIIISRVFHFRGWDAKLVDHQLIIISIPSTDSPRDIARSTSPRVSFNGILLQLVIQRTAKPFPQELNSSKYNYIYG